MEVVETININATPPRAGDLMGKVSKIIDYQKEPCPYCGSDYIIGPRRVQELECEAAGTLPCWWMACGGCSRGMETEARDRRDMIKAWNTRI